MVSMATGLPQWIHAPVEDWLLCGDLADATYIYNHDLKKENVKLSRLEQKLRDIDSALKLKVPLYTKARGASRAFAGFVASKGDDVYVVWRGTVLNEEWLADAQVHQENWDGAPGFVHSGFNTLYNTAMQDEPYRQAFDGRNISRVFVTGHSLGGALATLTACDLATNHRDLKDKVRLVTFSAPRSMSIDLARHLATVVPNHVRLIVDGDLVPAVPLYSGLQPRSEEKSDIPTLGKFLYTLAKIIKELLEGGSDQLEAHYHHAGIGISLSGALIGDRFRWTVGHHHSLKLILHLLDPKNRSIPEEDLEPVSAGTAPLGDEPRVELSA